MIQGGPQKFGEREKNENTLVWNNHSDFSHSEFVTTVRQKISQRKKTGTLRVSKCCRTSRARHAEAVRHQLSTQPTSIYLLSVIICNEMCFTGAN